MSHNFHGGSTSRKRKNRSTHHSRPNSTSPAEQQQHQYQATNQFRQEEQAWNANPFAGRVSTLTSDGDTVDLALFVQAYEADISRGAQARRLAESLEAEASAPGWAALEENDGPSGEERKRLVGSALIRWGGFQSGPLSRLGEGDGDEEYIGGGESRVVEEIVLVDRYDARLLLDALPSISSSGNRIHANAATTRPSSPGGWSDLPSDAEETFGLSRLEMEDFHREKRRKTMYRVREERLKARMEEEGEEGEEGGPREGDSDEEPDDPQSDLMRRTAAHLLTSPNPAQLEMRILANNGAEARFAFLRGRWKNAWLRIKRHAKDEQEAKERKGRQGVLGNLIAYGSDEDEDEVEAEDKADADEGNDPEGAKTELEGGTEVESHSILPPSLLHPRRPRRRLLHRSPHRHPPNQRRQQCR